MPQSDIKKKTKKEKPAKQKPKAAGNLKKYFGKLKLGLDGLEFQKEVRSEWN